MKKILILVAGILVIAVLYSNTATAQCSVCTKTVAQMGEKPARGLNQGILYLMMAPFAIIGFIGYRWWKSNRNADGTI